MLTARLYVASERHVRSRMVRMGSAATKRALANCLDERGGWRAARRWDLGDRHLLPGRGGPARIIAHMLPLATPITDGDAIVVGEVVFGDEADNLPTTWKRVSDEVDTGTRARGEDSDACGKGIAGLSHVKDVHVGTLLDGGSKCRRFGDFIDDVAKVTVVVLGELLHDVDDEVYTSTTTGLMEGDGGVGGIVLLLAVVEFSLGV